MLLFFFPLFYEGREKGQEIISCTFSDPIDFNLMISILELVRRRGAWNSSRSALEAISAPKQRERRCPTCWWPRERLKPLKLPLPRPLKQSNKKLLDFFTFYVLYINNIQKWLEFFPAVFEQRRKLWFSRLFHPLWNLTVLVINILLLIFVIIKYYYYYLTSCNMNIKYIMITISFYDNFAYTSWHIKYIFWL